MDFKTIPTSPVSAGIPLVHQSSHLSNFEDLYKSKDKHFFKRIEDLTDKLLSIDFEKTPKYIFLTGQPGSGKSHLMVAWYRALVAKVGYSQGDGALFTTFSSLAAEIIGAFQQNLPIRSSLVGYTQARWLFLDDVTSSERLMKDGSLEHNIFRDIIVDRYEKNYCLVASSNFTASDFLSEMDRLFGDYIVSRLSEAQIIQFPNLDLRKTRKE